VYRIWFERALPAEYAPLLEGIAVSSGSGNDNPNDPTGTLPGSDAIIAAARIKYNGDLMDRVPTLKVIARTGIGIDNISLPNATARGIAVCNAPEGPTISTAEQALTLLFAAAKTLKRSERVLREGGKLDFFNDHLGIELYGLRLGLVGMGRIGSRVAKVAQALGMEVAVYDPFISAQRAAELGVTLLGSLETLLRSADIVSLHVPLSAETRHLMNAERFAQMKQGAILINSARGGLVDEKALILALDSGHLRGAGLDVFDPEPPALDNPLLHRENVVATPHVAGATAASKDRLWRTAIDQALKVLRGEHAEHLCNPEILQTGPKR
jgi:D-3-phosphoglycerate dehydrogenase